jgi:heat shock protein HtpX
LNRFCLITRKLANGIFGNDNSSGKAENILPPHRSLSSTRFFIVNPLSGRGVDNLFSTALTENRVAALDKLSREMGLGGVGAGAPAGDTSRGP